MERTFIILFFSLLLFSTVPSILENIKRVQHKYCSLNSVKIFYTSCCSQKFKSIKNLSKVFLYGFAGSSALHTACLVTDMGIQWKKKDKQRIPAILFASCIVSIHSYIFPLVQLQEKNQIGIK